MGIVVIVMLEITTIGLTTDLYLKFTYHENRLSSVLFSISYVLCGFIAGYYYTIMRLDSLIMLLLVVLGVQRLVVYKHTDLYVITL